MRGSCILSVAIMLGLSGTAAAQWSPPPSFPPPNENYLGPLPSWLRPNEPAIALASLSEAAPQPVAIDPQFCPPAQCVDCPCDCCHCYPCECPQQPAPCIECPHVSTLSPFWNLHVFGAVQANMMFNTARPLAPGTPFFLLPDAPLFDEQTVDIQARSSSIGAALTGPEIGGFQAGGAFMMFLYNDALIVDRYGLLPVLGFGELKNEDWRIAAGLQFDVFCPNLPNMLTFSSLLASGNAGNNFRGQFRLERFLYPSDNTQWTIQAALSEPISTSVDSTLEIHEDNGWPNVELRLAWGAGEPEQVGLEVHRPLEIGASAVVGQVRTTVPFVDQVQANVYGIGLDFRWRVNEQFGFLGEAFVGEGLGTYNAGILQLTNFDTFEAIRTRGVWGEMYYYLTPCLHTHVGYGVDDPNDNDVAFDQIAKNQTAFTNLLWDITRQLRLGFEFTWRKTDYLFPPLLTTNEGVGFHTQLQFAF